MCSAADDPSQHQIVTPRPPAIHEVSGDREARMLRVHRYFGGMLPAGYEPEDWEYLEQVMLRLQAEIQLVDIP